MAGTMCIAAVLLMAIMVQADQCASGGECPSSDDPQNVASLLQTQLQTNVFKGVQEASDDTVKALLRPACAERKLVINSHVDYAKALDHLIASLKEHKFPLNDCVVFRGGANASADQLGPRISPDGITFVDLTLNSFDLTSFAGLSRYNNHSLVCADMYFYIHDTTQIGPCFPKVFAEMELSPTEVITPGKNLFANQCAFGRSVVDKFADDFEDPVNKNNGHQVEWGGCFGKACSIDHYAGKWTVIPDREEIGPVDMYHNSLTRVVFWYQQWDLYKFMQPRYLFRPEFKDSSLLASLVHRDYAWAPSCPRKCTMEGSDSSLCKNGADA